MTLKLKTYSSLRWTTGGSIFRVLLQLAQLAVLARLLRPEDYGLMAMVTVMTGLTALFADLGLGNAYVQRQQVSEAERSSLFWANIFLSATLALLLLIGGPFFAVMLGDARLSPLLQLASVALIGNSLGQHLRKHAEKHLNFRGVVLTEVLAAIAGFLASLSAALTGWGVYALVVGALVSALAASVLAWGMLADGWRPKAHCRWADLRGFMGFGGTVVLNDLLNEINKGVDILLGGRMLSAAALGLYSVPRQIVFQIQGAVNPIITRVGFPLIARIQHDRAQVRSIYLKTLNMTAATNAPLYIGVAAFSAPLVAIVFGRQWERSVELLSLLALWGYLRTTSNPVGSLLLGMGRADLSLKWNLAQVFVVFPLLWLGAQWGVLGLAWALLAHAVLMFIPGWFFLVRPLCHASLGGYVLAALRPALLAVLAVLPAIWMSRALIGQGLAFVLAVLFYGAAYLALSMAFNREWMSAMRQLIMKR